MRTRLLVCLFAAFGQVSCGGASSFKSVDSSGLPLTLTAHRPIDDWPEESWLVACGVDQAVGRITKAASDSEFEPITLDFCFGEKSESGYGPEAKYSRNGRSLNVCLAREDGYCDEEECATVVFYDDCSTFQIVEDDA